jgi:hypothetical protein
VKRRLVWTSLAIVAIIALAGFVAREHWLAWIARSLVCAESSAPPGGAIVVENFDPSYLLFERAAALQRQSPSVRVLVPVSASAGSPGVPNPVSQGIAELMARFARLQGPEIVPIRAAEPYALNTAYQMRSFLLEHRIRSVLVVAPAFRSRRSALVYGTVLGPAGVQVSCVPVFEGHTVEDWSRSWHGIEVVAEQFLKLQFYRLFVLRAASPAGTAPGGKDRPGSAA